MCTMIVEKAKVAGSARGVNGWFKLDQVNVSYDHPSNAQFDHAVNLDFVNGGAGLDARVAVELSPDSARRLMRAIEAALDRGVIEAGLDSGE